MTEETKNWARPIICGLIITLLAWISKNFWESGKMKTYIIDFLITFSPIIVGLLTFFIYRLIRDYRKLRKFSYRHDHAIENVQSLTEKIKIFEKEPLNRTEAINQISDRINKLEINMNKETKDRTAVDTLIIKMLDDIKDIKMKVGIPPRPAITNKIE